MLGLTKVDIEVRLRSSDSVRKRFHNFDADSQCARIFDHSLTHSFNTWPTQMQESFEWMDFKSKLAFNVVKDRRFRTDSDHNGGFRFLDIASRPLSCLPR